MRLLDDAGRAEPALSGTPHGVLAALAEGITRPAVTSPKPTCSPELFIALQRWCR